jgi:Phospholipid methyltransferase
MSPRRTANGDFFAETATEPSHDSVFGVLRDPMHGAYALGLVSAALISG